MTLLNELISVKIMISSCIDIKVVVYNWKYACSTSNIDVSFLPNHFVTILLHYTIGNQLLRGVL